MNHRNPIRRAWRGLADRLDMLGPAITIVVILCAALCIWMIVLLILASQPAEPERQTVTQYTSHIGGITRLCMAAKTGQHIDALSCQIVDTMNGDLK